MHHQRTSGSDAHAGRVHTCKSVCAHVCITDKSKQLTLFNNAYLTFDWTKWAKDGEDNG